MTSASGALSKAAFQLFGRHVNPSLAKFLALSGRGQHFVRAHGCALETDGGEIYTDWFAGFGSLNLGHNPPALLAAAHAHLGDLAPNLYIESLNPFAGRLAGPLVVHRMLRRKLLVQICGHDWATLRVEPPLIVSDAQCREFVIALREELDWIHANG